ncbi:MAG: C40 family peptidase [Desulfobulbaceae bacterium]|nr:C40 family peptidase [Desulfobulbaceae bacterium]
MNQTIKPFTVLILIIFAVLLAGLLTGCGRKVIEPPRRPAIQPHTERLARMGYSIQIGAFKNLDNAVRLYRSLQSYDLNAYYFVHKSGLFKVRLGDFTSRKSARKQAESIRDSGIIEEFYIVSPDDYAVVRQRIYGRNYVRDEIVRTAENFIGIPYRWGGSSPEEGFDCSGLAMAVYHLNGLSLPRVSRDQYRTGKNVGKKNLKRGDLVFFATKGGKKVSHVGIYCGNNRFIHAPKTNSRIRIDSLTGYFRNHYVGARTYI